MALVASVNRIAKVRHTDLFIINYLLGPDVAKNIGLGAQVTLGALDVFSCDLFKDGDLIHCLHHTLP